MASKEILQCIEDAIDRGTLSPDFTNDELLEIANGLTKGFKYIDEKTDKYKEPLEKRKKLLKIWLVFIPNGPQIN